MTGGHNSSVGLALGHKPTRSGKIHSPHPRPQVSDFTGFPLPASPFRGRGACVCRGGRGAWGLGLRKEEAGRGLIETLFQDKAGGALPPASWQPARGRGFWKSCPLLPPLPPSHMAPCPAPCPAITNGALCSLDREHTSHPDLGRGLSALRPSWPQERRCRFPGGETEAWRGTGPCSQGRSLPSALGVKMERGGGTVGRKEGSKKQHDSCPFPIPALAGN